MTKYLLILTTLILILFVTPVAAENIYGIAPFNVAFNDTSTNSPTAWEWYFQSVTGNNTVVLFSIDQNPYHTFYSGRYKIWLNASNEDGSNTTPWDFYIYVSGASSEVFGEATSVSPAFYSNVTSGLPPFAVQFYDNSACSPACTNWVWDFDNDGSIDSIAQNPVYTYNTGGEKTVKLIASNGVNNVMRMKYDYIDAGSVGYSPAPVTSHTWGPTYKNGTASFSYKMDTNIDIRNSTYLKYWLQNFSSTGNFSVLEFGNGIMAPLMHVFGFWIFLIIWGLYMFAVWIRSQDVTLPLVIGIISIGMFSLMFPKEALPVIIVMFVICGAIILTKLFKDQV